MIIVIMALLWPGRSMPLRMSYPELSGWVAKLWRKLGVLSHAWSVSLPQPPAWWCAGGAVRRHSAGARCRCTDPPIRGRTAIPKTILIMSPLSGSRPFRKMSPSANGPKARLRLHLLNCRAYGPWRPGIEKILNHLGLEPHRRAPACYLEPHFTAWATPAVRHAPPPGAGLRYAYTPILNFDSCACQCYKKDNEQRGGYG